MSGTSNVYEHELLGDWAEDAACKNVDPDLFFPGAASAGVASMYETQHAKAICAECPVRADCLAYALRNHEQFGVWGGTTPRERRRLWRR